MWIIANGAPKTGSTWPVQLLDATRHFDRVPRGLQNPNWQNSSVRRSISYAAARELASSPKTYLSKQHWHNFNKRLLKLPGIKILNSIRDIRDTFVSRYYHEVRLSRFEGNIDEFYNIRAKEFVRRFCDYQKYWINASSLSPSDYHVLSYERLHYAYEDAAKELFDFCGIQMTDEDFLRAMRCDQFAQQDSGPDKFFRKGAAFAYQNDLTDRTASGLLELADARGLLRTKRRIAAFNPALTPCLELTDVGL